MILGDFLYMGKGYFRRKFIETADLRRRLKSWACVVIVLSMKQDDGFEEDACCSSG